ncbi:MAG: T9SS type A sorting domain-containing protein [Bacteroidota bacterium]
MKTKLGLLLLLFGLSICIFAQEWAVPGATWYNHVNSFASPNFSYVKLAYEGDTVINGRPVQTIQRYNAHGLHCNGLMFGHQLHLNYQADQLYFYHPILDSFMLLIDFSAEPGDSWTISTNLDIQDSLIVYVDSLSTFMGPNQEDRQVQHVRVESFNWTGHVDEYETQIIEGIGFLTGLYPDTYHSSSLCDGSWERYLRCYSDDETVGLFFDDIDCDSENLISTSVQSLGKEDKPSIKISPNPVVDWLQLDWGEWRNEPVLIDIYTTAGQLLQSHLIQQQQMAVDLSALNSGLYFLVLYSSDTFSERQVLKLVKE